MAFMITSFSVRLSKKNAEGVSEIKYRQKRQDQAAIQDETALSAWENREEIAICLIHLVQLGKARIRLCAERFA
jgi:hypothetical protein